MAERYLYIKINKDSAGKRYYSTTLYPSIAPSDSDYYIYTTTGDRLDLLAQQYYGDASLWWIISSANTIPHDTIYIAPGTQLRIPTNTNFILNEFKKLNQSR